MAKLLESDIYDWLTQLRGIADRANGAAQACAKTVDSADNKASALGAMRQGVAA